MLESSGIGHLQRKNYVVWIVTSAIWIAVAIRMIVRGDEFGWFLLPVWLFVSVLWITRALRNRIKSGAAK
jgi:hypothetical protein